MRDTLDSPKTLSNIEGEMGLSGKEKFDPNLQDRMGFHLLKRRGYEAFLAKKISATEFGKRLAQEWASFPVLVDTKGSHRQIKRGQSYYAGDGLNRALLKPATVEEALSTILAMKPAVEPPIAQQSPSQPNWLASFIAVIVNLLKSIFSRKG